MQRYLGKEAGKDGRGSLFDGEKVRLGRVGPGRRKASLTSRMICMRRERETGSAA